jgi:DMSO/TMAO reductase YedYZ molybdopterin-dependent catalytic subunit
VVDDPTVTASRRSASAATNQATAAIGRAALAGLLSAAVALGVSELAAGALTGAPSLIVAVGDVVVDLVPLQIERAAIALFGTADKAALLGGILLSCTVLGALLGVLALRALLLADLALMAAVGAGVLAALVDPRAELLSVAVVGVAATAAGVVTLRVLLRPPGATAADPVGRRKFLQLSALAIAVLGALAGRVLAGRSGVEDIRAALRLPVPAQRADPPPPGAELDVEGLTPLYVPNEDFYRIDTALFVPQVDPADWSLQVTGRVDRPFRLDYAELLALPQIEADVTLSCVSNEVGGDLVGNARWQGVPLVALLERAGVRRGADQLLGRSVDGFTAGFPTGLALSTPGAMVAVGMNGEPLPTLHGFPARLVVPGLYGYISATKWLTEIRLTTRAEVDGYWIGRGWAKDAPIKTQSRIDVPKTGATVAAGPVAVAGIAWAPIRGIDTVQVRVDGGPWETARLADALGIACWRQWVYRWDATPGKHGIAVRATDGSGDTQTAKRVGVVPNGATGHHTVTVTVTSD